MTDTIEQVKEVFTHDADNHWHYWAYVREIRKLVDELKESKAKNSDWLEAATYGNGSPIMTPQRLQDDLCRLMRQRDELREAFVQGNAMRTHLNMYKILVAEQALKETS